MTFNLNKDINKKVHFIGIGGISMSALAEILLDAGYSVSGSDMKSSPLTEKLERKGAKIFYSHTASNVDNSDLVVFTAAISEDNPELIRSRELNLQMMDRAEFLGELMKKYSQNIAVAGTHGKTTTTSMLSHLLMDANVDPTILVGGELDLIQGNVRTGNSDYFITEACEYKSSFLKFHPHIGIILNIDADHLDYFRDIDHIQDTFRSFAKLIPSNGYLIGYAEDERVMEILNESNCNKLSYGFTLGDITASDISINEKSCASFKAIYNNEVISQIHLNVPGKHNILNALASCACAIALGIHGLHMAQGLSSYKGTHKRFEFKGVKEGVTVIDDYAHHPTEIKATLSTARSYPHERVICIFQPHTFTRTITLFEEFSESFNDADLLILADIYAAREPDTKVVSSDMLGDKIRSKGGNCINLHSFQEIVDYLKNNAKSGDLVLTVGAGDIVTVADLFLK